MRKNLMVGTHKVSTNEFIQRYEEMVWDSDPEEVKEAKRRKQSLAYRKAMRRENR